MSVVTGMETVLFSWLKRRFRWIIPGAYVLLAGLYFFMWPLNYSMIDQFNSETLIPDFYGEKVLVQTFYCPLSFRSIRIKFATFARKNTGTLCYKLFGFNDHDGLHSSGSSAALFNKHLLCSGTIQMKTMTDNQYYSINVPAEIRTDEGHYSLVLTPQKSSWDNSVSPWICLYDAYDRGKLVINTKSIVGDLTFRVVSQSTPFSLWQSLVLSETKHGLVEVYWILSILLVLIGLFGFITVYFLCSPNSGKLHVE